MNREERRSQDDDPKRIEEEDPGMKGEGAEDDLRALEDSEEMQDLTDMEDAQDLEILKIRRTKRLKCVAWILVLAVTAGALFGILSGGAFGRWFHAKTQSGEAFVEETSDPTWDLSSVYNGPEEAKRALETLQNEVELALSQPAGVDV
ncbi:MAG: hypothetical protein GT601_14435, partial [Acidaminobacter sp.]|uniref:hypothetical protein n=1 Tax=Acidaminobacter sp. TaxID=1872102 RepID=UPI00137DB3CC